MADGDEKPCDAAVPAVLSAEDVAMVELLLYTASMAMPVDELNPWDAAIPRD